MEEAAFLACVLQVEAVCGVALFDRCASGGLFAQGTLVHALAPLQGEGEGEGEEGRRKGEGEEGEEEKEERNVEDVGLQVWEALRFRAVLEIPVLDEDEGDDDDEDGGEWLEKFHVIERADNHSSATAVGPCKHSGLIVRSFPFGVVLVHVRACAQQKTLAMTVTSVQAALDKLTMV